LNLIKANIDIKKNVTKNAAHKERAYCNYTQYNIDNIYNQILYCTLNCILQATHEPGIAGKTRELILHFEHVTERMVNTVLVASINYNRKTARYKDAMRLAELIISGFSPVIQSGNRKVFSLLFDMNELFETYVGYAFTKNMRNFPGCKILLQKGIDFWENKQIRPDIIIEHSEGRVAIDTKWKILTEKNPSDPDLKQMYVYSRFFGCEKTHLLYPKIPNVEEKYGEYSDGFSSCSVTYIDLFESNGKLRSDFTGEIEKMLFS
jgi:5-methylcytosine-specific restriction enzyme subunit McrC